MTKIPVYVSESEDATNRASEPTLGVLRGDEPSTKGVLRHIDPALLKRSVAELTSQLDEVFRDLKAVGDFQLAEVSISVEVSAEGGLILLGKAGVSGGINLKFTP